MNDHPLVTPRGLTPLVRRMGVVAAFASGTYSLALSAIFAVVNASHLTSAGAALITLVSMAWATTWLLPSPRLRRVAAPMWPMLLAAGVVAIPSGQVWPPIATLAFASTIVAISLWPPWAALVSIGVSAVATFVGSTAHNPTTFLVSTDFLGGTVTTIVALTLPIAILIVAVHGRLVARQADALTERALAAQVRRLQAAAVRQARLAAARRVHETLLNTLVTLADPESPESEARARCAQDLAQTEVAVLDQLDVESVLRDALPDGVESQSGWPLMREVEFPSREVARAARDALIEAIRNAERHGGGVRHIAADITDGDLVLTIDDRGADSPSALAPRLGMDATISRSTAEVGGAAAFETHGDGGLRVTLKLPLRARQRQEVSMAEWNVLTATWIVRLAMLPTVVAGLLFVPFAAGSLAYPTGVVGLYAAFAACTFLLVPTTSSWIRWRKRTSVLALCLGVATLAVASLGSPTCSSAVPMHWVIYSLAGGALLPLFSLAGSAIRFVLFALWVSVTIMAGLAWPSACMIEPVGAAIENLVWSGLILAIFFVLERRHAAQKQVVADEWMKGIEVNAQRSAAVSESESHSFVFRLAKPLFESIASGARSPRETKTNRIARSTESLIRSYLAIATRMNGEASLDRWNVLFTRLSRAEAEVHLHVAGIDSLKASVIELLDAVLSRMCGIAKSPSIRILVTPAEVFVTGDRHLIQHLHDAVRLDDRHAAEVLPTPVNDNSSTLEIRVQQVLATSHSGGVTGE